MSALPRPEPGPPRAYAFPAVVRSTLGNDLRVAVAPMPRLPLVTLLALVDAGASRDSAGCEGVAALTARALGEGTSRLDGAALTESFERLGTGLDTSSDWDDATAQLTVMPARLEAAIALLAEVLTTPAFAERDVERLRAERLAELLHRQVEPRELADEKFAQFLYVAGSRYAIPGSGNSAAVRRLGAEHVRRFHRTHYVPGATTLIFVGDVSPDVAFGLTERTLGAWRAAAHPAVHVDDRPAWRERRVRLVRKTDAPQSELRVGHRGAPRRDPDYFPITVMNALLGGLFSSRINLNLRERHAFTYRAQSGFDWRRDAGPFVVSTAVETGVTDAATREILREIERMREETVGSDELSLATAYLEGVFPIRYETTSAVARAIAVAEVHDLGGDYYTGYRERVRRVTAEDVHRAAVSHLFPDELLVLAVGDADAIREPVDRLGIGLLDVQEPDDPGIPA